MVSKRKKMGLTAAFSLILAVLLSGCGNDGADKPDAEGNEPDEGYVVSTDPVTLTVFNAGANGEPYYKEYIEEHVLRELPHITIDYIHQGPGFQIRDLIVAGTIPDVIYMVSTRITELRELGMLDDLLPLAAKHGYDMDQLLDGLADAYTVYGDGKLLYMPWGLSNFALYYNVDIFDLFGVDYPRDGMNWDDVYSLARQLTRSSDGIEYRGFDFTPNHYINFNQLSLPFVDPDTDKAAVQTDGWKRYFETFARFYNIPGNEVQPGRSAGDFRGSKTLAMTAGTTLFPGILQMMKDGQYFNFDIVSFPSFPEQTRTGLQTISAGFAIPPQSRNKDAAMQFIITTLSEEVQMEGAGIFRLPVVKGEQYKDALGQFYPELSHINAAALVYNTNAPTYVVTEYDQIAGSVLVRKFNEYKSGAADINTILREAEEEINLRIADAKAAK